MGREKRNYNPETSATKRRPIVSYSSSGVEVIGHVLKENGKRCNDQNEVDDRFGPHKAGKKKSDEE